MFRAYSMQLVERSTSERRFSTWLLTGFAADALLLAAIGIFMHISTTILFESEDHHLFPVKKLIAVATGLLLGIASVVFQA